MITALYIIGVIAFAIPVIAGFLSGSFWGFIAAVAGGISSAIVLFALARILENQYEILNKLQYQETVAKQSLGKKECIKCNYKYDADYSSCPHCGYKDQ